MSQPRRPEMDEVEEVEDPPVTISHAARVTANFANFRVRKSPHARTPVTIPPNRR